MSRSAEQKIRLLVLYDILHKETDAEHQLSTAELGGMLRIVLDFTQPIVQIGILDACVRTTVAPSAVDWHLIGI